MGASAHAVFPKSTMPISAASSILGLPAIRSVKLSQINSEKMVGQGNSVQNLAHIPSTLPYKRTVKLGTYGRMLWVAAPDPILGRHQPPNVRSHGGRCSPAPLLLRLC